MDFGVWRVCVLILVVDVCCVCVWVFVQWLCAFALCGRTTDTRTLSTDTHTQHNTTTTSTNNNNNQVCTHDDSTKNSIFSVMRGSTVDTSTCVSLQTYFENVQDFPRDGGLRILRSILARLTARVLGCFGGPVHRYRVKGHVHGRGPHNSVRLCTWQALTASLDRLRPHNAWTLHTSWTVQEVIAAVARILESSVNEVGTCTPADWFHLLRFSLKAEQLRQGTPFVVRPPSLLMSWQVEHSVSLQALLGTAPLRWTSLRGALGAPRGLSRVRFGSVFYMPGSVADDSALLRVALLDTDLLPSLSSRVTVAPLFNFSSFQLCVYWWFSACLKRV